MKPDQTAGIRKSGLGVLPFSKLGRTRPRWGWWLAGAYVAALFASHVVRASVAAPRIPPGVDVVTLPAIDHLKATTGSVHLAYREYGERASWAPVPLVLLHGSPGSGGDFDELASTLGARRRVVAPDLPGFGYSSTDVDDYSFVTHASYVRGLLDHLGVQRAHVLGFSMGGGVALSLADLDPNRIASLTMLSAIGVQEMELFGQYHLNHAIHGVQLAGLWLLGRIVPHFGALERPLPFARNFFDSDQRPLRAALARIVAPTSIVHGRKDRLVPVEAAIEHARLVPQSELRLLDADHFMLFEDAPRLSTIIEDFLDRADRGAAPTRSRAESSRLAEATRPFNSRIVPRARAVSAMVLGGLVATASWAFSGVAPVGAGVLVAQGRAGIALALVSSLLGALAARSCRHSVPLALRAAARTIISVGVGGIVGAVLLRTSFLADQGAWTRAVAVTSLVGSASWLFVQCATYRRRRLLFSSWLRLKRWEYWPPWVFYAPVLGRIVWLMIKHRGATVFTAANPAMLAGGFVGESKFDILKGLGDSSDYLARSGFVDGSLSAIEKIDRAERFLAASQLALPVVLKPNHGQRGSGVVVARTRQAFLTYLASSCVDTIIQEYVPGLEFGVFYYRRPSDCCGHILSITSKQVPAVVGDGRATLERLVLQDPRTVGMARFHLRQHSGHLAGIPAPGQLVSLGDCGSHCRGALFMNGESLRTPALEHAIDDIAKKFDGFYFGRFDVRAASVEEFTHGRGFKIIELNGVTSEATHIYDPGIGLWEAYRVLFEQWRLAFEIGAANANRGARVWSVWSLARMLAKYRRDASGHLEPQST